GPRGAARTSRLAGRVAGGDPRGAVLPALARDHGVAGRVGAPGPPGGVSGGRPRWPPDGAGCRSVVVAARPRSGAGRGPGGTTGCRGWRLPVARRGRSRVTVPG